VSARLHAAAVSLDARQLDAAHALDRLCANLGRAAPGRTPRGVYLHGGVGRGKTMLLDALVRESPVPALRMHLHEFARDAQRFLHEHRGAGGRAAADLLALDVAARCRLLALDELRVTDAYEAALFGRLLPALFSAGVVLAASSNQPPRALVAYDDALAAALARHCRAIDLGDGLDYRALGLALASRRRGLEIVAADPVHAFRELVPAGAAPCVLDAGFGRTLTVPLAWWPATCGAPFDWLCGDGRGPADYLALARRFQLVVVGAAPLLGAESRGPYADAARRFASLLDVCYDARVSVAVTTAHVRLFCAPLAASADADWLAAMERAQSRWREMSAAL